MTIDDRFLSFSFSFSFSFSLLLPNPHTPLQAHQLVEAQKRKPADKNNPTLYWEYKWTEDAEAEVICSVLHSNQLIYNIRVAWSKLRPSISSGSRGGIWCRAPLILGKKDEITEGRKLTGQAKQLHPPSPQCLDLPLSMALHSCLFPFRVRCTPPSHLN